MERPRYSDDIFGTARDTREENSLLSFSWGLVNDSQNHAIEGIREDIDQDPILRFLANSKPIVRQRVSLNSKGAAKNHGKFDTTLVPKGTRYTAFITFSNNGSAKQEEQFEQLLSLLHHPAFRIGHSTRAGGGHFKVTSLMTARWDLTTADGYKHFIKRPRRRAETNGLTEQIVTDAIDTSKEDNLTQLKIPLQAEEGWRIGGGEYSFTSDATNPAEKQSDLLPESEPVICWAKDGNNLDEAKLIPHIPVLPASAVKGALSHRLAYHYRRLEGIFATEKTIQENHTQCPAVQTLFGYAVNAEDDIDKSCVGNVIIDDIYLSKEQIKNAGRQMHNKLDHFSGGVIDGALFEEEMFWQTKLQLNMTVTNLSELDNITRQAFDLTLQDLQRGWLPLGAGGSRSLGRFVGTGISAEDGTSKFQLPDWNKRLYVSKSEDNKPVSTIEETSP